MPNIVIVGFPPHLAKFHRKQIEGVLTKLGRSNDAVTTILPATVKYSSVNESAPYLIVRNTSLDEATLIAKQLATDLQVDVEYQKIDGFIPTPIEGETNISKDPPSLSKSELIQEHEWEQILSSVDKVSRSSAWILSRLKGGAFIRPKDYTDSIKMYSINQLLKKLNLPFKIKLSSILVENPRQYHLIRK